MIKSITLKNFQSHENTSIDFSDGVNAIVGLSDSGKTAILRALRWVITNKPSGEEFRSYWGGSTSVTIELDNEIKVTRGRSNSDNYYALETPGGLDNGHQEFRAFGQDVPEEIKKIFSMSDINMADQMDAPFLLSFSPGEVAQTLNKLVNLEVIDRSISNIRKEKMEADRMVRQCEDAYTDLHVRLEGFNYLSILEEDVSVLEILTNTRTRKITSCTTLKQTIQQIKIINDDLQNYKTLLKASETVVRLTGKLEKLEKKKVELHNLQTVVRLIERDETTIKHLCRYEKARKTVDKLLKSVEDTGRICKTIDSLNTLVWDVKRTIKKRNTWDGEYKQLKDEFDKIFPETCPLCGQVVKQ